MQTHKWIFDRNAAYNDLVHSLQSAKNVYLKSVTELVEFRDMEKTKSLAARKLAIAGAAQGKARLIIRRNVLTSSTCSLVNGPPYLSLPR